MGKSALYLVLGLAIVFGGIEFGFHAKAINKALDASTGGEKAAPDDFSERAAAACAPDAPYILEGRYDAIRIAPVGGDFKAYIVECVDGKNRIVSSKIVPEASVPQAKRP